MSRCRRCGGQHCSPERCHGAMVVLRERGMPETDIYRHRLRRPPAQHRYRVAPLGGGPYSISASGEWRIAGASASTHFRVDRDVPRDNDGDPLDQPKPPKIHPDPYRGGRMRRPNRKHDRRRAT